MNADEARSRTEPVRENMRVQRMVWRVERVGWYSLLLIAALALAGLFSKGVLSDVTASSSDGRLRVEYQRFARNGAHSQLLVEVRGAGESPEIALDGELLDGFSIETLQPEPERSATHEGRGVRFTLNADEQGRVRVRLGLKAESIGRFGSTVSVAGQRLELRQFIYP